MTDARKIVKVNIEHRGWVAPNVSEELKSIPVDAFRLANRSV